MTHDRTFQPEFGPNGAVLNAPSMTPDMRAKIDQVGRMPPATVIWREARSFGFILVISFGLVLFGEQVRQLLQASAWWSGALFGALAVLGLAYVRRVFEDTLRRWELIGEGERVLNVPAAMRVLLAFSDIIAAAAFVAFMIGNIADLNGDYAVLRAAALGVALVALGFSASLRWLVNELKWTWRAPA